MPSPPDPTRLFQFYRSGFRRHYDITTAGNRQIFYAEISSFTPSKPEITLHAGPTESSPTVAVSKFPKFSRTFTVGLGDPAASPSSVQWESMSRDGVWSAQYRWQMTLSQITGERGDFIWKHTSSVAVDGKHVSMWSSLNYKLVDAQSNKSVAVFTSAVSLDKCGTLQIKVDYGEEFDTMVIMTLLSLYEKVRRNRNASAAAGGGGGGGG